VFQRIIWLFFDKDVESFKYSQFLMTICCSKWLLGVDIIMLMLASWNNTWKILLIAANCYNVLITCLKNFHLAWNFIFFLVSNLNFWKKLSILLVTPIHAATFFKFNTIPPSFINLRQLVVFICRFLLENAKICINC